MIDPNFIKINQKLRRQNLLNGFDVVEVSREIGNVTNYIITYRNGQGTMIVYQLNINQKGEITIVNIINNNSGFIQPYQPGSNLTNKVLFEG